MNIQEYATGNWVDSRGSINLVRFKKRWGEHTFSDAELEALLQGKKISFSYKNGDVSGHLQYRWWKDKTRYFGFCPDFDKDYTDTPIYDHSSVDSKYEEDTRNAALMNQFMRVHYYLRLLNSDGTCAKSEFINDKFKQKQGIDVIVQLNNMTYIIDEKAQLDYMYRTDGPLETFALELLNSSSGNVGWFLNDELVTEYYMFIWPHANRRLTSINDIDYAQYALVKRARLKSMIEDNYLSLQELKEYALRLSKERLDGSTEKCNRLYFKQTPFDKNAYLVYTREPASGKAGKVEKPVNLVVKKKLIEQISEENGILPKIDEANGGVV